LFSASYLAVTVPVWIFALFLVPYDLNYFFPYSDLFLEAETVWLRGQCQPTPGPLESPFGFPGLHKRMMVPNSEESNGSRQSLPANAKARSSSKLETSAEKDSEEYRKLRERNNEAVKKSRTRTKMRTQATLEKVEKLRQENSNLEGKIDGLKKELDLLKELFMSHAGCFSLSFMRIHNFSNVKLICLI